MVENAILLWFSVQGLLSQVRGRKIFTIEDQRLYMGSKNFLIALLKAEINIFDGERK